MSFGPLMLKLIPVLLDDLPQQPSVIELGNQTFDPTISGTLTKQEDQVVPLVLRYMDKRGKPYDRQAIEKLASLSVNDQKPGTAAYYKALGFSSYDAIDVNSKYGSLVMDLNVDLQERYGFDRQFDLVTNNGTGEHIFNQYAVFKNAHNLTRVGGIQLYVLPFHNWMNHGFFNFNPILFGDLAAANKYKLLRLSLAISEGAEIGAGRDGAPTEEIAFEWQPRAADVESRELQQRGSLKPFTARVATSWILRTLTGRKPTQMSRMPDMVAKLAERSPNINVVAALQRTHAGEFVPPLQGMYSGSNVESAEMRAEYSAHA